MKSVINALGKKERANFITQTAKASGVSRRTIERRYTDKGTQKRGQENKLTLKEGNAVRKYFRENDIVEFKPPGRSKKDERGHVLSQETFDNLQDALDRANQLNEHASGQDAQDTDLYPGSLFDNAHTIIVDYVPGGSRFTEGDVHHMQTLTAPTGGVYLVRAIN